MEKWTCESKAKSHFDRDVTDSPSFKCNTDLPPIFRELIPGQPWPSASAFLRKSSHQTSDGLNHLGDHRRSRSLPSPLFFHINWIAHSFSKQMRNLGFIHRRMRKGVAAMPALGGPRSEAHFSLIRLRFPIRALVFYLLLFTRHHG